MLNKHHFFTFFAISFSILSSGCGPNSSNTSTPQDNLIVFCGAGIRPPVAELLQEFEKEHQVTINTDYAGSEILLSKIRLSKMGDVYIPGDRHYIKQAQDVSFITHDSDLCYFIPSILVKKGNPLGIHTLADLAHKKVRLGTGDPKACAIGKKTKKLFEKNNISAESLKENLKYQSTTVNELGLQVDIGRLDAVIVWDATQALFPNSTELIHIPLNKNIISTVAAGTLTFSKSPQKAQELVNFLASAQSKKTFKKHHYTIDIPSQATH